jgi:ribosome-binding protein aMBF1 (putative translation factor)
MFVCHRCDNKGCVNPAHLVLGTGDENIADKVAKRRQSMGQRQGGSKLTDELVATIRSEYRRDGASQRELAERYGVSQQTLSKAIVGDTWRHVTGG